MRERGFLKEKMANARAQGQDHSQNHREPGVGVSKERGGRQGPTGDGGGMMADIFVLKYFCIYLNDTRATGAFRERSYVIGLVFY